MKALIIGSGSIGLRHATSLRALRSEVDITFLREGGRAKNAAIPMERCKLGFSLEDELASRPDIVVIANPSSLHLRYLEAAIRNNIPFYAEKPLVTSQEDLAALKKMVLDSSSVPTNLVGCNLRFLPSLQRLQEMLQAGEIGNLVRATFVAGQWLPDWRPLQDYTQSYSAKKELGGGVLLDLIHEIDAAHWLLGDFDSIYGVCGKFSNLSIETADVASILMSRKSGPLVSIQLDYVSRSPVRNYTFVGDAGTIEWNLPQKHLLITRTAGRQEEIAFDLHGYDVPYTYVAAMHELLTAIDEGRPTSQSLDDGIAALEIAFNVTEIMS